MTTERVILPVASARQTLSWLRRRPQLRPRTLATIVAAGVLGAGAAVIPPVMLGKLVDNAVAHAPATSLLPIAAIIVVCALVGGAGAGIAAYLLGRLSGELVADLRELVVRRALYLPVVDLERTGRGDLLARTGSDVDVVEAAGRTVLPTLLSALLSVVVTAVAMLGLDWRLGVVALIAFPFYAVALRWYLPRSGAKFAHERRAVADRSQALVESMIGVRTVHAYRLNSRRLEQIDGASISVRDVIVDANVLFTRLAGRVNRAEFAGLSAILVAGYLLVRGGDITVGATTAAALLFHRLFVPVGALLFTFGDVQEAGASLARLVGVAGLPEPPTGDDGAAQPRDATLELRDIEFGYDDARPVLHGVSLTVRPGCRVALVGSTGAGKSTLAAIAAGTLRPSAGTATIGGVRLDTLSPARLRRQVGIITQEVHVFAGPLIDDLRLAKADATIAEAEAALAAVGANAWVAGLDGGVDAVVGEGGYELTAAQAQQLALARLVLADPAVCVLDEATAEAGSRGARDLEHSAAAATAGRTTLIVAHRLTQARSADVVVVLENGRVAEQGAPESLLAAGGRFADLWHAWQGRDMSLRGSGDRLGQSRGPDG